ncbi:MAG TPA: peptidoglycan bridge formation glycyltransferase FemA/FemB family protein [Bacteroidia bacterium]|nr:peptidoglycan bridge formation glycyltransferase FemA/FemB family protein [Bacteroidia bacterium]HNT79075.1 peptidoglycan bridge formation glycyltransferase FemA/FemB family protein [Bacteroidia bacterium]
MKFIVYSREDSVQPLSFVNQSWPVFFLPEYAQSIEKIGMESMVYFLDETNQSVMPCKLYRKNIFSSLQIICAPHKNGKELSINDQELFLNEVIKLCKKDSIADRFLQAEPTGYTLAKPKQTQHCAFGTYRTALQTLSEEEILNSFKTRFKQGVAASLRMGAQSKFGREHFNDFYTLYQNTMSKAGMPVDPAYYFKAYFEFLAEENANVAVVYENNDPIGGVFYLSSGHSAYITHAGSDNSVSKNYGAVKQLHYELMCRLKSKGVQYYDFAGVRVDNKNPKLDGIFRFKAGFGGDLHQGYLWKQNISNFKTNLHAALLRIKLLGKEIPKDIIDQQNA